MPVFEYRGVTPEGQDVAGGIDADTLRGARGKLKRLGVFPTAVSEGSRTAEVAFAGAGLLGRSLRPKEVALFTRQLATLFSAGLPVTDALTAVLEQADRRALTKLVTDIREAVREGRALADALERHPGVFSPIYVQMVRAGEAGGDLDEVFQRLAEFLEAQVRLRDRVWAALAYPMFLCVIGGVVLAVLMVVMIPRVTAMFADLHRVLPLSTRVLIAGSHLLTRHGGELVVSGLLGAAGLAWYFSTPGGRIRRDTWALNLPVFGRVSRSVAIARLARSLGTLLASGVPLLAALDIAKRVMGNVVLERAIDRARDGIAEGKGLAQILARTGVIPPVLTHLIAIGEKSGDLDGMLLKAAEVFDHEAEAAVNGVTSLLAPMMVLVMGLLVLFIVMAILVPIFELSEGVR